MKTIKSLLLITMGGISTAGLATPNNISSKKQQTKESSKEAHHHVSEETIADPSTKQAQEPTTVTVGVKGMVCAFCANGIEKSFRAQPEVETVVVSLEKKFLKLTFKPGKSLSNEKISTILKEAGYEANFGG